MRVVWDERKSRSNLVKHHVSFELASLVFDDPWHVSIPDPYEAEDRWRTLGMVGGAVVVLVVHTVEERDGEEEIRVISARKATRAERQAYSQSR